MIGDLNFKFSDGTTRVVSVEEVEFDFLGENLYIMMQKYHYSVFENFFKELENDLTSYDKLKDDILNKYEYLSHKSMTDYITNSQIYVGEMNFIFGEIESKLNIKSLIRKEKLRNIIR
jgi:hypothetical protein